VKSAAGIPDGRKTGERRARLRVRQWSDLVNLEERRVKPGLTEAGAIEIDEVRGKIAEAPEQKRKRQRCRVPAIFDCRRGDGSERNYKRPGGSSRDAYYCGLQVKIRRDDSNNYPRH